MACCSSSSSLPNGTLITDRHPLELSVSTDLAPVWIFHFLVMLLHGERRRCGEPPLPPVPQGWVKIYGSASSVVGTSLR